MTRPVPETSAATGAPLEPPAVAIQGEAGSFSALAAAALLGTVRLVAFDDFEAAARSVAYGSAPFAVLPVANSRIGEVLDVSTLTERLGLEVVAELVLPVRQSLVVIGPEVELRDVREVRSHPVALAQCGRFLREHPWISPRPGADTAAAVREVCAAGLPALAAIGPATAAALHGGHVLIDDVADADDNRTRFALLRRAGSEGGPLPPRAEAALEPVRAVPSTPSDVASDAVTRGADR